MLRSISRVTFTVDRFDESRRAFDETLGYNCLADGTIDRDMAEFWQAPSVEGARFALLEPASTNPVHIRLIESPPDSNYAPLRTYGWNAAEFHVRDVASLAAKLPGSLFSILGGPRDLLDNGTAIALQARGPSDEVVYLTEINGERMQATYGKAECAVDRAFIVVLGSSNVDETRDFYRPMVKATPRPRQMTIRVLATAHDLDPMTHKFPIASAVLEQQFRIEIDGYPSSAIRRPVRPGHLPPGLSMVSFRVDSLDKIEGIAAATIEGRRHAMLRGPDDELIELVEDSD